MPPRKYWKTCYESDVGRMRIASFYNGYPSGVQMAYETGRARSRRIPTPLIGDQGAYCPSCKPVPQQEVFHEWNDSAIPSIPMIHEDLLLVPEDGPILLQSASSEMFELQIESPEDYLTLPFFQ